MSSGFFTPGTVFWRVNSDALTMLSASRALLLELAHPLVAAGVAAHSNYRGDPFGRLLRTLRTITEIMFADASTAKEALGHLNDCHAKVKGELKQTAGLLASGAHYDANDPLLRLWVLATLFDSCLAVYDHFAAPLSSDERREYYREGKLLGQLLGIPPALMPATYEDFDAYVQAMIQSDMLTVSDEARDIAGALWAAPLFGGFARIVSWAGIGLLPERIRKEFRIQWSERDQAWLRRWAAASRRLRPRIP